MTFRRILAASLLAVIWFSAVLHGDLEAIGWMFDHDHRHIHADGTTDGPHPAANDDHEPVLARDVARDGRLVGPALPMPAAFPVLGLLAGRTLHLQRDAGERWTIPREREGVFSRSWQFVWRCAPDSAAPPPLS